jgi:hypothetical protein
LKTGGCERAKFEILGRCRNPPFHPSEIFLKIVKGGRLLRPLNVAQNGRLGNGPGFRMKRDKKGRQISPPAALVMFCGLGFFDLIPHPVTLAFNGNGFCVMQQAIQDGGG